MLEVQCKKCEQKHYPKTLGAPLYCCSTKTGVVRLVTEFFDPEKKRRWWTVSNAAIVRWVKSHGC